ncbi:MAG: hypothetical protein ACSHXL_00935 [Bacteroidota bacterium]
MKNNIVLLSVSDSRFHKDLNEFYKNNTAFIDNDRIKWVIISDEYFNHPAGSCFIIPEEIIQKYQPFADSFTHPLGKIAKLFFLNTYFKSIENNDDIIIYVDPDVYINSASELLNMLDCWDSDKVIFAKEVVCCHSVMHEKDRLIGYPFDNPQIGLSTIFHEVNTGVILSNSKLIISLLNDFSNWYDETVTPEFLSKHYSLHWHDQDAFRVYLREGHFVSIGCFDFKTLATTNSYASGLIRKVFGYYRMHSGERPLIIHAAGRSGHVINRLDLVTLQIGLLYLYRKLKGFIAKRIKIK